MVDVGLVCQLDYGPEPSFAATMLKCEAVSVVRRLAHQVSGVGIQAPRDAPSGTNAKSGENIMPRGSAPYPVPTRLPNKVMPLFEADDTYAQCSPCGVEGLSMATAAPSLWELIALSDISHRAMTVMACKPISEKNGLLVDAIYRPLPPSLPPSPERGGC